MKERWARLLLLGGTMGMSALAVGCIDECCNGCGRNYYFEREDGGDGSILIDNFGESGDECTIDDQPRSLSDGLRTARVRFGLAYLPDGFNNRRASYSATILHSVVGRDESFCGELPVHSTDELIFMRSAPLYETGDEVCIIDFVRAQTVCTNKYCGTTSP